MADETIITDAEAQALRERLAAYDRQQAELAAIRRTEVYHKLKPAVESDQFAEVHQMLTAAMADGDDGFFGIHANAIINIMPHLVNAVQTFMPYEPTPGPASQPDAAAA